MFLKHTQLICIAVLLHLVSNATPFYRSSTQNGPDTPILKTLRVGDRLPEFKITNVLNYDSSLLNIADFKGKYILLDFWSTGCAGCITAWPKMIELQRKFKDRLQIILVDPWDSSSTIKQIFEKRKSIAGVNVQLPTICGPDSVILNSFSISGLPFVVWVDQDGVIQSVTDGGSVNASNIEAMLNRRKPEIPQYIGMDQIILPEDYGKPIFVNGNAGIPRNFYWQSTFARGQENLGYGYVDYAKKNAGYYIFSNQSIRDQYRFAYSNRYDPDGPKMEDSSIDLLMLNQIKLNINDTSKYVPYINGQIVRSNSFVYQLIAPVCTQEGLKDKMRKDLERFVGLNATWETRKMKCLVLSSSDTNFVRYKSGDPGFLLVDKTLTEIIFNNVPIKYIIGRLENVIPGFYYSPYPLVDETGFKGNVGSIHIKADLNDYKSVDRALRQYKMRLTLQYRLKKILILKEPPGFNFDPGN